MKTMIIIRKRGKKMAVKQQKTEEIKTAESPKK